MLKSSSLTGTRSVTSGRKPVIYSVLAMLAVATMSSVQPAAASTRHHHVAHHFVHHIEVRREPAVRLFGNSMNYTYPTDSSTAYGYGIGDNSTNQTWD
jgi:hypothetical protein